MSCCNKDCNQGRDCPARIAYEELSNLQLFCAVSLVFVCAVIAEVVVWLLQPYV
jgi:hypothetical protein